MKFKVKTAILKDMVLKASKGASNNKLIPITGLMAIELKDNKLRLITTDATNYLYVSETVQGEDFYVVVFQEQFTKLISKMTSDMVELSLENSILEVSGNGNYKIQLPLDENGELIRFTDPVASIKIDEQEVISINTAAVQNVLNACSSALAVTFELPCYTQYYLGDIAIATDSSIISSINANIIKGHKILVSPEILNLFVTIEDETVKAFLVDNKVVFWTPKITIYGILSDDLADYQEEEIISLIQTGQESECKIVRQELLDVLDRILLFVGAYDNSAIKLIFDPDTIIIQSLQSDGIEKLSYVDKDKEHSRFECTIDINQLNLLLKAQAGEVTRIQYGNDSALKLIDNELTQIVALIQ